MSGEGDAPSGLHPDDHVLFDAQMTPTLRAAVADLSLLLGRGYADRAALTLVGDRYQLHERQRMAVRRASCAPAASVARASREVPERLLTGATVHIDAFNVLITVATALRGGVVLACRDGCMRDVQSSHRLVLRETGALALVAERLARARVARCLWIVDRPVSNSARVAEGIAEVCLQLGLAADTELAHNPDRELMLRGQVVLSSDAMILDADVRWANLTARVIESVQGARVVDLR